MENEISILSTLALNTPAKSKSKRGRKKGTKNGSRKSSKIGRKYKSNLTPLQCANIRANYHHREAKRVRAQLEEYKQSHNEQKCQGVEDIVTNLNEPKVNETKSGYQIFMLIITLVTVGMVPIKHISDVIKASVYRVGRVLRLNIFVSFQSTITIIIHKINFLLPISRLHNFHHTQTILYIYICHMS